MAQYDKLEGGDDCLWNRLGLLGVGFDGKSQPLWENVEVEILLLAKGRGQSLGHESERASTLLRNMVL